jgi:ABC-type transport system involved in resistance to organic solvents, periplasmic component
MKISNETKVGALTAVAITLLILGFNFLKGESLFKSGDFLYAKFVDAKGLQKSNPVYVNGVQIGSIYAIESDENLKDILITIKLSKPYKIPVNSQALVKENPLGTNSIQINLGDSKAFFKSNDTISTINTESLLGSITNQLSPLGDQLKNTLSSLNKVLTNIDSIFNPEAKNNLQQVIANVAQITVSLHESTLSLQAMLDKENGSVTQSLNNVNTFTKNLAKNNSTIDSILTNVQVTTKNLSKADFENTLNEFKKAATELNTTITKINSSQGSLGALVNDRALYNNLTNTVRSANILMDDLRAHPKRYVNVSVFGRKDKTKPLTAPLDSTKN